MIRIMLAMLIAGLATGGTGLYFLVFTDMATNQGIRGLMLVVMLIAASLILLIPAKVYLILRLMKVEFGPKSKKENKRADKSQS